MVGVSGTVAAIGVVAGVLGVMVGISGIVATLFVMSKHKALEASMELFSVANHELRAQVVSFQGQLADERAACAKETGELRGQLQVLTSGIGKEIAASVLQAFRDGQASPLAQAG